MNRAPWFMLCAALLWLAAPHGYGQNAAASAKGFDTFVFVKARNIFDPNRKPGRIEQSSDPKSSSGKGPRISYFTLTGTMVADGRALAFFSGSRSEYSRVIPVGDLIAGYKVISITPIQTEMEHDGKSFVMAVGHRLQLDGGNGEVSGPEVAGPSPSPSPPESSAPVPTAPSVPSDKTELLRRMMERAQAERRGN